MKKKDLRKIYLKKRNELTTSQIEKKSLSITHLLIENKLLYGKKFIHTYLHFSSEVSTLPLINCLERSRKKIVVSKTSSTSKKMHHFIYDSQNIIRGSWGIPEPNGGMPVETEHIEAVIVPLLTLDKKGFRVGYGKGIYDHFLGVCRTTVSKIGLSFFDPCDRIEDVEPHDIPLDYLVTPRRIWSFDHI